MRCALYARFSCDAQDARSITDQVAQCRRYATKEGWEVVAEYTDAAISGSALANRPVFSISSPQHKTSSSMWC